jgi:5-methylcytosine-specific restriction protein B
MRHRVIPLLAEYFHEDWGKIAAVLGDAGGNRFLSREALVAPPGFESEYGGERYRWHVRGEFDADAYAGLQ